MSPQMIVKMICFWKIFFTLFAKMFLFCTVSQNVSLEISWQSKWFFTDWTRIRFFTSMNPLVYLQWTFSGEGFGTIKTLQVIFGVLDILTIVNFLCVICKIFFSAEFFIAFIFWWISSTCFFKEVFKEKVFKHMLQTSWFFSWTALCAFKWELNLNLFMHFSHWNFFALECIDTECFLAYSLDLNFFLHTLHSSLRSGDSEWIDLLWVRRCVAWENVFGHVLHLYGFSPVWTLSCTTREILCRNFLSHRLQAKDNSCMWIFAWLCNKPLLYVRNAQDWQTNGFSMCISWWSWSFLIDTNGLEHILHLKCLFNFLKLPLWPCLWLFRSHNLMNPFLQFEHL